MSYCTVFYWLKVFQITISHSTNALQNKTLCIPFTRQVPLITAILLYIMCKFNIKCNMSGISVRYWPLSVIRSLFSYSCTHITHDPHFHAQTKTLMWKSTCTYSYQAHMCESLTPVFVGFGTGFFFFFSWVNIIIAQTILKCHALIFLCPLSRKEVMYVVWESLNTVICSNRSFLLSCFLPSALVPRHCVCHYAWREL